MRISDWISDVCSSDLRPVRNRAADALTGQFAVASAGPAPHIHAMSKIDKADAQWREELDPSQYHVLREAGTEHAFTGKYWNNHDHGIYRCAGCGAVLFTSDTKFDSGKLGRASCRERVCQYV